MKRQRYTAGAIVEIPINNGEYYCYGQLLDFGIIAFFDYKSDTALCDYEILDEIPVAFRVGVYSDIISNGIWMKVAKRPIRKELTLPEDMYIYHEWDQTFYIYKHITGEIIPSNKDNCRGMECCAIWDYKLIEDRLIAHFKGIPCEWLKEHYELFSE